MVASKLIDFSKWGTPRESATHTDILPWLDLTGVDTPVPYLFTLNGTHGLCPEGTLVGVQGKEKTGKSAVGVAFIISALCPEGFLGIAPNNSGVNVLWVDTEQDTNTLRMRAKEALRQANTPIDTNRVRVLTLMATDKRDRLQIVENALRETGAKLVLLDGLIDLCEDFNDSRESEKVYQKLISIANDMGACVVCVIHENPHEEKARGHLGTMLGQRASQLFRVTNENGQTRVIYVRGRFHAPDGFPEWGFEFGEGFEIHETDISKAERFATKKSILWDTFEPIFKELGYGRIGATALKDDVVLAQNVRPRQAFNIIKEACAYNVLYRDEDGKRVFYSLMGCTYNDIQDDDL